MARTFPVLDDFSTGSLPNPAHLDANPRLRVTRDSVSSIADLCGELISQADMVLHLAAAVGVKYVIEHPLESLEVNTRGPKLFCVMCHKFKESLTCFNF